MNGKHVVIIIAEGYSEADMWTAYYRFQEEGADVIVAGPKKGTVYGRGLRGKDGRKAEITHTIEEARQLPCDLIFLPGGTWSAMELRMYDPTLHYIKTQIDKGVLVCAVEHAAWILISSGAVKGRKICCTSDCGDDIANSGGIYLPGPGAVQDGNLITASDYSQIYKLMRLVMKQSKQKKDVNVVNNLEGEGAQESLLMNGKRVLLIIAKGYTEPELWSPCQRFLEEGAEVIVAGPEKGMICGEGVHGIDGCLAEITCTVEEAMKLPYDVLFLAGGLWSPMELRCHAPTLRLVRESVEKGILTCAICHAPWILISAGVVKGRKICCPEDMAVDVRNAGGTYLSEPCVLDGDILTGYAYPKLPEFMKLVMETVRARILEGS